MLSSRLHSIVLALQYKHYVNICCEFKPNNRELDSIHYRFVFLLFKYSEAGWTHAAIHPGGQHNQPFLRSLGPGGGYKLYHSGPVYWPLWRESSQQEGPFSYP